MPRFRYDRKRVGKLLINSVKKRLEVGIKLTDFLKSLFNNYNLFILGADPKVLDFEKSLHENS